MPIDAPAHLDRMLRLLPKGGLTGTVPCKEIREGHQRLDPLRGGVLASLIRIKGAIF
jgi:hypothetical protein